MALKQNVLILIQYLSPGGIEWMVAHLVQGLGQRQNWNPFVVVYDHNGVEPIDHFFLKNKIPFFRLQKPKGFSLKLVFQILKIVRDQNINVIHTHHLGALMIATFIKWLTFNRVKITYTQHSFIHLAAFPRYRFFESVFCRFADSITAVSEQVQNEFKTYGISTREILLVRNGSFFPKTAITDKAEQLRKREELLKKEHLLSYDLQKINSWIVYLGRIHQGKGQDQALLIWNTLPPEVRKKTALLFIGPVPDQAFHERLKIQIGTCVDSANIFILPATLYAQEWMQVSDVFLSSSESEGGPMAPLEALGSGTPCVLSNIEGHQFYRNWCDLYDLHSPAEGASQIQSILEKSQTDFSNYRTELWKKSEDLRFNYSIEGMVKRFEDIYRLK